MTSTIFALLLLAPLQDPDRSPHEKHLKPLEFLIGEWEGVGSGKSKVEFAFEWTLNKNFIRTSYVAKDGEKVTWTDTGMIGWDVRRKKIVMVNFGMDGTLGHAESADSKDAESYLFEGNVAGPYENGEFRAIIKKLSREQWSYSIERKKGEKSVSMGTTVFERRRGASWTNEERARDTKSNLHRLGLAILDFKLDHGRYPEKLDELVTMPAYVDPKDWPSGGYVTKVPTDGWCREFLYRVPGAEGSAFDLLSLGSDGREGGSGADADLRFGG